MTDINRRSFLQGTVAAGAAAVLATSGKAAASERLNLAVVGLNGRGKGLARGFADMKDALVTYLCDVDENILPPLADDIKERQKSKPKTVKDFREALDDKTVDAVVIATPDHWHALASIWACQAGKHVYVEKPCCHTLWEGRRMIECARHTKKVMQVGTQSRSVPHYLEAIAYIRDGKLGTVHQAKAWNSQLRKNIGKKDDSEPPKGVDYKLWLGPAPEQPFRSNRFHSWWRWWWDFGCGDIGNDGVHDLDIARWGLGVTLPSRVTCAAGKLFFDDDQQTPDTQFVTYEFPAEKKLLVYEQRLWSPYFQEGYENGVAFYGTEGHLLIGRAGWKVIQKGNKEVPQKNPPFTDVPHRQNFIDCVKDGKVPNGDIEEGHYSAALAHLGNIAARVGQTVTFDPKTETIKGDAEASKLLRRASYRKGFEVPEKF